MKQIFDRYSLRSYQDRPVEKDKIDRLIKAGFQAPSAHNQQAWEVVVIRDKDTLHRLSDVSKYFICLQQSPLAIVTLANKSDLVTPEFWQQDLAALSQNILLEAVHLELGGVWLGVAPRRERMAHVADILGLPETIMPFSILSIGYPKKPRSGRERSYEHKIFFETYGKEG
ncbi:MAG TPA: nitroreductase family protein [Tissierellia bacterium]|nr:nitroreductase family protein [Tissierellia bacterium]